MTTARATTPAVHIFKNSHLPSTVDPQKAGLVPEDAARSPRLVLRTKQKKFTQRGESTVAKYINSGKPKAGKDQDRMVMKSESLDKRLGVVRQGVNLGPAQTSATIGFTLPQFHGFRKVVSGRSAASEEDSVKFEPHEVRTEEEVKRAVTWGI